MKTTVTEWDFIDAFKNSSREDNFSIDGLRALFEYLENYEQDTGQEIELDVIAFCCEYTEYSTFEEIADVYDIDLGGIDALDIDDTVREYLDYNTSYIEFSNGVIIQDF